MLKRILETGPLLVFGAIVFLLWIVGFRTENVFFGVDAGALRVPLAIVVSVILWVFCGSLGAKLMSFFRTVNPSVQADVETRLSNLERRISDKERLPAKPKPKPNPKPAAPEATE